MKQNTDAFKAFRPRLNDFIRENVNLSGCCRAMADVHEKLLAVGRDFFMESEYATHLSPQEKHFAVCVLESHRILFDAERQVVASRRTESFSSERVVSDEREKPGFLNRLIRGKGANRAESASRRAEVGFCLQAQAVTDRIAEWFSEVDSLLTVLPQSEPVRLPEPVKTSPLLKERYCLFFQELLGVLHRKASGDQDVAREEGQVTRLLLSEGIRVQWPEGDLLESTPEFRVVVDPFAGETADTAPCLSWDGGWLPGERMLSGKH